MQLTLEQMVKAGMHFGHQARKWNPKMAPYIYGERNGIHLIDLVQTFTKLKEVKIFLKDQTSDGKTVLFVGTKNQATKLVSKAALESNSFFVNHRWLGGMLTNWKTIRASLTKLDKLEQLEVTGALNNFPKKEAANLRKLKERLTRYLGGLKGMTKIPDIVVIIGQPDEITAVYECNRLGIRSVTILDTDCDPSLADLFIPANDDSVGSIQFLLEELVSSINEGKTQFIEKGGNNQKKGLKRRSTGRTPVAPKRLSKRLPGSIEATSPRTKKVEPAG
uniref:Small ribosomal subunit protein uS2c n=1 Tax=Pedinomonas tuberculata TaxID=160064 RepID=A0A097KL89_9CHLO|nr:ribosomal protein S2 [Pedinomonas tuberculata]AIT93937.1 ribosomal protein S2 [Pedinomonas tuberculata]